MTTISNHGTNSEVAQASTQVIGDDRFVDPKLVSLARQAASEGVVLLRNDGALPLREGTRVAVFGRVQVDWIAVGYGSGGDVNAPYISNLLESLRELDHVRIDDSLSATYEQWCEQNPPDEGYWGHWPRFYDEMPLQNAQIVRAAKENDVAVVVIGRAAGEDRENTLEPGSYYLTEDEKALLEQVSSAFDRTVVVVNTGNVMDLAWVDEYRIDALVLAWLGGMEGGRAIADVLCGKVEPGGRLTDTIAYKYEDYPSSTNFGGFEYNNYVEDIFVGYRYFETFKPEAVQFPFGFGLGYTTFQLSPLSFQADSSGNFEMQVRCTNTGTQSGRQVIQVYVEPPVGELGRPKRELVSFTKTKVLEPGKSCDVTFQVRGEHFAAYDDEGVTGNRSAWVLDSGNYQIHIGSNVRETNVAGAFDLANPVVVSQVEEAAAPDPAHPFDRLTLQGLRPVPTSTVDLKKRILDRLPKGCPPVKKGTAKRSFADVEDGSATLDDFVATLSPEELASLAYGDITMDSMLGVPGNAGTFGGVTKQLRSLGIPPVTTTDGPSGIRVSAYASLLPCGAALGASWDKDLVHSLAQRHAEEMLAKGSDVLLSPGMNIHRDPLCGRNFEYFSEDPVLTGHIAAAVVSGIQSKGLAACPKHFAANNQETNRTRNDSRVSERALREVYLRGFQICVEQANPLVIMTSYNKINGVWGHYHYDLVTTILRGEWGFDGVVVTDWWMRPSRDPNFEELWDSAYRVRAQVDVLMPGGEDFQSTKCDQAIVDSFNLPNGITLEEMQRTARNVLSFLIRSGRLQRGPVEAAERPGGSWMPPLSDGASIGAWLDSPVGRPLVMELLGVLNMVEEEVFPVRSAKLRQVVPMSNGVITAEMVQDIVERANNASQDSQR